MDKLELIREKLRRVAQDKDVDDKKGTQPKKYYSGVKKDKKDARDAHFKKGASMSDDNPNAYKPAPGDKDKDGKMKKTKPSKHTNKFKQMYGEMFKEVFLPYNQPWNDKKGLHQTLGLLRDTKSRNNAAKAIEKLAKKHKVEFEVDGQGQKQFVYLTSFDGKAIDKLKKDLMKNKKLTKALDTINGVFKEETMPGKGNASDDGVCEVGTDDIRQKYQADTPGQAEEGYIQETEKAFHEQKSKVKKNFRDVFQNPLKGYPANEDFEVKEIK